MAYVRIAETEAARFAVLGIVVGGNADDTEVESGFAVGSTAHRGSSTIIKSETVRRDESGREIGAPSAKGFSSVREVEVKISDSPTSGGSAHAVKGDVYEVTDYRGKAAYTIRVGAIFRCEDGRTVRCVAIGKYGPEFA